MTETDDASGGEPVPLADYENIDFRDLGFDLAHHVESLRSFARLGLAPASVKPTLRAREMVFVRVPAGKFLIGAAGETALVAREQAERDRGCIAFEVIHQAQDGLEAEAVRTDVERYFQRHFPGRLLHQDSAPPALVTHCSVYIALFAP